MSEREVNARRNWKAQTFPYDYFIPDDTSECQYCLTEKQAELLRGIIEPLAWQTRWWSDSDATISQTEIEQFRNDLTRRLMMSCCNDSPPLIFAWIDGVYSVSDDGGLTYHPAPEYDPRNTSTTWPKPSDNGIETTKCQNADGVVAYFRDEINDQIADDMSITAIVGVIAAVMLILLSAGTLLFFTAQLIALAGAIFGAGVATWKASFDSDVWDDLRCIIYSHMSDDATVDDAGLSGILTDIGTTFSGLIAATLSGYINALGLVGLNNMIRSGIGDADADCSACNENCYDTWSIALQGGTYWGTSAVQADGHWEIDSVFNPYDSLYYVIIESTNTDTCCLVSAYPNMQRRVWYCGQEWGPDNSGGVLNGDLPPGCVSKLLFSDALPFRIQLQFDDCE